MGYCITLPGLNRNGYNRPTAASIGRKAIRKLEYINSGCLRFVKALNYVFLTPNVINAQKLLIDTRWIRNVYITV